MQKQQEDWVRGSCIGRGAYGTVNLAVRKSDCAVFAVKSVDKASALPSQVEALENEIRILREVSSPYVVGYLGDDTTASCRNLHMEYLPGGTVADFAKMKEAATATAADVEEGVVRSYTWCILSALRDLHYQGIVHCDVKGSNVLVGPTRGIAKLADFGSAVEMELDALSEDVINVREVYRPITSARGTPLWMAPEVIRREYQGPESDVWSLGCTVIEMITGKPGWEERSSAADTLCQIGYSHELPQFPSQLSELGKDFLDKCLRREASTRWSCDQLLHHPFVSLSSPPASFHSSPRCVLDWFNSDSEDDEGNVKENDENILEDYESFEVKAKERLMGLVSGAGAIWESDGWLVVREGEEVEQEGARAEFGEFSGVEKENSGFGLEYSDSIGIGEVGTSDSGCSNDVVLPSRDVARDGFEGQHWSTEEEEGENSNYSSYFCNLLLLFFILESLMKLSIIFANYCFLMCGQCVWLFEFGSDAFTSHCRNMPSRVDDFVPILTPEFHVKWLDNNLL